jgi:hypothetical protein
MTVDSGELYVAEQRSEAGGVKSSRIDTFSDSSGAFALQFPQFASPEFLHQGVTVGHSTGEAQVYVGGDVYPEGKNNPKGAAAVLSTAGSLKTVWTGADTPNKGFGCFECEASASIAVDANSSSLSDWAAGDVYVVDIVHRVVDVFKPLAGGGEEYVAQLTGPEPPGVLFSHPVHVAVNPLNGEVMVTDGSAVDIFKPAVLAGQYEFAGKLAPPPSGAFGPIAAMTVDGGNGEIYVVTENVVDEFDSTGGFVGRLTGTPVGASGAVRSFSSVESIAVDPASHDVYVADREPNVERALVDVFGGDIVIPDVATTAATNVMTAGEGRLEATLNGTVNPDKEGEASCWFVWGTSKAFGQEAKCEPEKLGEGSSPVGVHGTLSAATGALAPDTTYYYRLQASNKNGTNPGEESQDQQFTTPGPGLHGASVSSIASTSATLQATINPHENSTSYYFQYGKSGEYEAQIPLAPGAPIGSGGGDVEVVQHVQGLAPSTVYHYRVVVVSEVKKGEPEAFAGPDQTFVTQALGTAFSLPDARQWELVSPPNKQGANLGWISEDQVIQASASGGAIAYIAVTPTEGVPGYVYGGVQIMSSRGAKGWSSQNISLPHVSPTGVPVGVGQEYRFFSSDLSLALIQPFGGGFTSLAPESFPPDSAWTPYVRHDSTCAATPSTCFRPLVTLAPGYADVPESTTDTINADHGVGFVGASPDLAHVIVQSKESLTSPPPPPGQLYEWSANSPLTEPFSLVSLLPPDAKGEERPARSTTFLGLESSSERNAVSVDGSRVVWSTGVHLYLRDMVKGRTVQLDVPEAQCLSSGECGGTESAEFQVASSDGSRVFFTDTQRLTKGAGAVGGQRDLYECAMVEVGGKLACELSDVTPVSGSGESANVEGVVGASEDGSRVYFVADGVLGDGGAHGANPGNCSNGRIPNLAGACNLYVWHEGTTSLIAVLSGEDAPDWAYGVSGLDQLTGRVSPDGEWLAFMSDRPLTGYDNRDALSGKPDEEVYLYRAGVSGPSALVCGSCDPTGARPVGVEYAHMEPSTSGESVWNGKTWIAANVPGWTPYEAGTALYQSRYLSKEGRLFFNSSDGLAPSDINHNEDVYEYEPAGVGDCSVSSPTFSARSGGCVGLISSGLAPRASAFLDASESGSDVFFLSGERLTPQDIDTAMDVYDAHACTAGSPCFFAPVTPPACTTADACRVAPSPQPAIFGAPSSATFNGAGNISSSPVGGVRARVLTRAQRLAGALRACGNRHGKRKRNACRRTARKRYGAKASGRARASGSGRTPGGRKATSKGRG